MNYQRLEAEILADIDYRLKELTTIKTLPIKPYINKKEKAIVMKFAIPNIYSIWEGYVKFVFRTYINEINQLSLNFNQLHNNILSHTLDTKFPQFTTGFNQEFNSKCQFFDSFFNNLINPVTIDSKLPTESNINCKVLNILLRRFNLQELPENPYNSHLGDLLRIRNSVAHGENSIIITQSMIDENVNRVVTIMDCVRDNVLIGCQNSSYIR